MTKEDLMNEWLDKIDFFKERLEKRKELIKDINVSLIGVDIDSERKVIGDFLRQFRNTINNDFSVYDECIGIPSKSIAEYILGEITEEKLICYLDCVIEDILKQYQEFGGNNGIVNLNYDKCIIKQVGNCYLLANEIKDTIFLNDINPTAKKHMYHGLNGVFEINNGELVSCKYSRS